MKIGVILCQYNEKEFLDRCLAPWIEFRETNKNHKTVIVALDGCFDGFERQNNSNVSTDGSLHLLHSYHAAQKIDYFQKFEDNRTEHDARNIGVSLLKLANCDVIWLLGVDEFYTVKEIENAIAFVEKNPFACWFRIEFKNLVFAKNTYIRGFNPGRIFRTSCSGFRLHEQYYDDDFSYIDRNHMTVDYKSLASLTVPFHLCSPLHETWLDCERSKNKIVYQKKRWGKNGCSFDWVDGHLVFNEDYYKTHNLTFPELTQIEYDERKLS